MALTLGSQFRQQFVYPEVTDHGVPLGAFGDEGRIRKDQVVKDSVSLPEDCNRG
ncbi:hypothetical protein GCM10010234_17940 [Streptomyces hawaiiensis]|uniref:hypothetical protein n=1 Tax=Streptomyces hawaiiensis TaxID=67305 RepID=UPI0031D9B384